MRATTLLTVLVALSATTVIAQQPGDVVAVTRTTELRVDNQPVGKLFRGNTVTVGAVNGPWLWVNFRATGWIQKQDVVPLDKAVDHFTADLARSPRDAEAFYGRGRAWLALEKWDRAAADFSQAIEIAPEMVAAYEGRALASERQRKFDQAVADYSEAIRRDPLDAQAYRLRAGLYAESGNYAEAIADYNRAVRLFPNDAAIENDRAWLLATCPDPTYRNGEQAVEDARRACEASGWKVFNRLGTLAAAYAEAGDFASAVEWQTKCLDLSPVSYRQAQRTRLTLYTAGKPYRESAGAWK